MASEFEQLFQDFMRAGGFVLPCPSEQFEREQRGKLSIAIIAQQAGLKCKHGLPIHTCADCALPPAKE